MRAVRVELGARSYDVHIGAGLLAEVSGLIPDVPYAEGAVVICDRNVMDPWGDLVEERLASRLRVQLIPVEPGERSKSFEVAGRLLGALLEQGIRRTDLLVALGGGMVGDLAGFVASVYQRGMSLVQLPTSLLAQVDAAIGGKTAVNLPLTKNQGKNMVGSFHQPVAVIADIGCLSTLPEREFRSGLAEVVKYGFCLDPTILDVVEQETEKVIGRDAQVLEEVVARCAAIKAGVVAADERDVGDRRVLLNYGHTLGHALEALGGYERWLHGEAISVGLAFAGRLAYEMGMLDTETAERHIRLLERLGLPTTAEFETPEIMQAWSMDKKHRGGQRWVLLQGVGKPLVTGDVDESSIVRALDGVQSP